MNRKEEMKEIAIQEMEKTMRLIDAIPDDVQHHVDFVANGAVFFKPSDFSAMLEILHGTTYKMASYYMSLDLLAVKYIVDNNLDNKLEWVFYLPPENLDDISGGRCHIETVTRTSKTIVCEN